MKIQRYFYVNLSLFLKYAFFVLSQLHRTRQIMHEPFFSYRICFCFQEGSSAAGEEVRSEDAKETDYG